MEHFIYMLLMRNHSPTSVQLRLVSAMTLVKLTNLTLPLCSKFVLRFDPVLRMLRFDHVKADHRLVSHEVEEVRDRPQRLNLHYSCG